MSAIIEPLPNAAVNELEKLKKDNKALAKESDDLKKELASKEAKIDLIAQTNENLNASLKEVQDINQGLHEKIDELSHANKTLSMDLKEAEEKNEKLNKEIYSLKHYQKVNLRQIENLEQELNASKSREASLLEKFDLKDNENANEPEGIDFSNYYSDDNGETMMDFESATVTRVRKLTAKVNELERVLNDFFELKLGKTLSYSAKRFKEHDMPTQAERSAEIVVSKFAISNLYKTAGIFALGFLAVILFAGMKASNVEKILEERIDKIEKRVSGSDELEAEFLSSLSKIYEPELKQSTKDVLSEMGILKKDDETSLNAVSAELKNVGNELVELRDDYNYLTGVLAKIVENQIAKSKSDEVAIDQTRYLNDRLERIRKQISSDLNSNLSKITNKLDNNSEFMIDIMNLNKEKIKTLVQRIEALEAEINKK